MIIKILSQRNKTLLIYKNFIYNFDRKISDKFRWICQERKCPGYVFINEVEEVLEQGEHLHEERKIKSEKL